MFEFMMKQFGMADNPLFNQIQEIMLGLSKLGSNRVITFEDFISLTHSIFSNTMYIVNTFMLRKMMETMNLIMTTKK